MSLNTWIGMGRLTKDPEIERTQGGTAYSRFSVAVDSKYKPRERPANFINCIAWGKTAEFLCKYFEKGSMICVEGEVVTGSYEDRNGVKRYTTEVSVERLNFTGQWRDSGQQQPEFPPEGFQALRDDDLPF